MSLKRRQPTLDLIGEFTHRLVHGAKRFPISDHAVLERAELLLVEDVARTTKVRVDRQLFTPDSENMAAILPAMTDGTSRSEPSEAVEATSAAAGALTGTMMSLVAGPFVGSASGELVARALRRAGLEIQRRVFAPRQEQRAALAFEDAVQRFRELLDAGEDPRTDDFFNDGADGRSDAEELLEGMLLKAADVYEERKLPYMSFLYASFGFHAEISAEHAHYLLKVADRLSYRQLVLLAVFASSEVHAATLHAADTRREEGGGGVASDLVAEMDDLGSQGILGVAQDGGFVAHPQATMGGGSFAGITLTRVAPMLLGATLIDLMELDRIPGTDRETLLALL